MPARTPGSVEARSVADPDHPGYEPWGQSTTIDLHGCNHAAVSSGTVLRAFLLDLVPGIGMVAHGNPIIRRTPTRGIRGRIQAVLLRMLGMRIDRFGEGDLEGWTGVQLIETSAIAVHFDEVGDRALVDVVSCNRFDPAVAVRIAVRHLGGTPRVATTLR